MHIYTELLDFPEIIDPLIISKSPKKENNLFLQVSLPSLEVPTKSTPDESTPSIRRMCKSPSEARFLPRLIFLGELDHTKTIDD